MTGGEYLSHKMLSAKIKGKDLALNTHVSKSHISSLRKDVRQISPAFAYILSKQIPGFDAREVLIIQVESELASVIKNYINPLT